MPDFTWDPRQMSHWIDELPDGVIFYSGPQQIVAALNRTARAFLGNRPGIIGRPMRQVYREDAVFNVIGTLDRVYATGRWIRAVEWRVMRDPGDGELTECYLNFVAVPLRNDGAAIVGVAFQFTDVTDLVLHRAALEAETADLQQRYAAAQDVTLTLQRSLLPATLPVLPGLRIAAHYLVADAEQAAGGDWFDAVPLDGRVVAAVGDVVGHGAQASAVMGQLRAVLVEFLCDGDDLTTALARLDRFAGRVPGARGATVCLALVDPADGSVIYACAGHPPPLVVSPDGATRFLPLPGGGPLGVAGPAPVLGAATLAPGEVLLCYSDGLVERADEDLVVNLTELAAAASAAVRLGVPSLAKADPVDRIAELTVERMTRQGFEDDVTVLAVRRTGALVDDLAVDLSAEPGQLPVLRERLDAWLGALGAGRADAMAISLSVLEATANAIEHAYRGAQGGRVRVEGTLDGGGRACMTVIDHGTWRQPDVDPGSRGRGLALMRSAMDAVEIERSGTGTTLLLDRQLSVPPVLGPAQPGRRTERLAGGTPAAITSVQRDGPRLVLAGPLDLDTVAELRQRIWAASRGGSLPLTLDLRGVTHLASVGIQLLYELVEEMGGDGHTLQLVAPAGTPAGYALSLSGLDQLIRQTGQPTVSGTPTGVRR